MLLKTLTLVCSCLGVCVQELISFKHSSIHERVQNTNTTGTLSSWETHMVMHYSDLNVTRIDLNMHDKNFKKDLGTD